MAKLTEVQQRFIVQELACYDSPQQVSNSLHEEFGIEVPRTQVARYDPTKVAGRDLAKRWRELFFATRENFKREAGEIAIAQRSYRLRTMQRIAVKAEDKLNLAIVLQVLEQAAKEVGDAYVNRRMEPVKPVPGSSQIPEHAEYVLAPDEPTPDKPVL
ncbi:DUF2280 domain-containing protein [Achromobacter sp. PAB15]|uniref:DUF2280 domain-containing protein n=1 Tax=Achromobacter sp. PAB15 TaxID=3233048 RepID=UPI003F91B374